MDNTQLFLEDERIKTFKKWPFNDKHKCNVKNMAEAGFYSVATCDDDLDAAKCFLCGKELDGWEANDDPWLEHKSHAPQCAFVQLGRKEDVLYPAEFLSLVKQYMVNEVKTQTNAAKEIIEEKAKTIKRKCLQAKRHN